MQKPKRLVLTVLAASLVGVLCYGLQSGQQPRAEQRTIEQPTADGSTSVDQNGVPHERGTTDGTTLRPLAIVDGTASRPSMAATPQGHPIGFTVGSERQGIRIAELEALLDANDGELREREQHIRTELTSILDGDPVTQSMEVRCAEGFCRLKLDKPVDQGMAWHEIDHAIAPVTRGEMIFGAEPNGETRTTAYVYFSPDLQLPMAAAVRTPEDE